MPGGIDEALHDRINRTLQDIVLRDSSSCSIFKVPNQLREINEKAYEPEVISIGPYHRGKEHLKAMEVHKRHHLKMLLHQGRAQVQSFVIALVGMEKVARNFYFEPLDDIGSEEFVEMMLLDGCFIVELILQCKLKMHRGLSKYSLTPFMLRKVMRDLLLVENQLPLCVLSELWNVCNQPDLTIGAILNFFDMMMPPSFTSISNNLAQALPWSETENIKHLLHLLHYNFYTYMSPRQRGDLRQFIRSATELNEAGIKFQRRYGESFDVKFQNGVMSIPDLIINDDTEFILRNLVAYEQCYEGIPSKCFTDYITFMDCLINTEKDVELLCRCGVFENRLGDHKVVATMFNRLRDSVLISEKEFMYCDIFDTVNAHCNRSWNKRMAIIRHDYFNAPGAFISFTSAIFLLLCTLLQTLFSILPSHR